MNHSQPMNLVVLLLLLRLIFIIGECLYLIHDCRVQQWRLSRSVRRKELAYILLFVIRKSLRLHYCDGISSWSLLFRGRWQKFAQYLLGENATPMYELEHRVCWLGKKPTVEAFDHVI